MLKKIREFPVIKKKKPFEIQLTSDLESKVEKNWKEFLKKHDGYWDGELLSVTHFDVDANIFVVGKAKYSWLIYSQNHEDLDIRSLFVAILFKTLDDKYVIIKNNHDIINIIGGMVEEKDLSNDKFHPAFCLQRELLEELNLDLYNRQHVCSYQMKYLNTPNPGRNYGIVYTGVLNFTSSEFLKYFIDNKSKLDHEISKLLLLDSEEVKSLDLSGNHAPALYVKELMDFETDDNVH